MRHILLIVDDDAMIQKLHSMLVKKNDLAEEFLKFDNGKLALDFVVKYDEDQVFIVLLDLNMPIMNGWEFLDAINDNLPNMPIFVAIVSSSIDLSDIEKAKNYSQVIAYIDKPLSHNAIQMLKNHPKIANLFHKNPDNH